MKVTNMTGMKIGRLTVLPEYRKHDGKIEWLCECSCGTLEWRAGTILRQVHAQGRNSACATCRAADTSNKSTTHGATRLGTTRAHRAWAAMMSRCYGLDGKGYKHWGQRGITVCHRWRFGDGNASGVECFVADMGQPRRGLSLDRIENDGNYEPGNCRWATATVQALNKRHPKRKAA